MIISIFDRRSWPGQCLSRTASLASGQGVNHTLLANLGQDILFVTRFPIRALAQVPSTFDGDQLVGNNLVIWISVQLPRLTTDWTIVVATGLVESFCRSFSSISGPTMTSQAAESKSARNCSATSLSPLILRQSLSGTKPVMSVPEVLLRPSCGM